jgi:hypothetical protein
MKRFIVAALPAIIVMMLITAPSVLAAQVSIGIRIGPPPPPRIVRVVPVQPAPEYVWVNGYWYPVGNHWRWHAGYWTLAPYPGSYWLAPRYGAGEYFEGYWEGPRGRIKHDHRWDHDRNRDFRGRHR